MDEGEGLWQRLTEWNRSPIYRFYKHFRVRKLIQLLKDENRDVRGDASAVPALIEKLKDKNRDVRWGAAEALGKIGDASAVPALIEALKDEKEYAAWSAARALGKIGGTSAVPVLIEVLEEKRRGVRLRAVLVLENIIKQCKSIEELEKVEECIKEGSAVLRKERNKGIRIDAQIRIARLTSIVAQKKDELAPKRDLLLTDKPKPPKRGGGKVSRIMVANRR